MKKLILILLCLPAAAGAYEVNGVKLGGGEADVKKAFPSALCKPLEWKTNAADRRCDDGQISLGGIEGRITLYLKAGAVQGYGMRFDVRDLERVKAMLKQRWGAPMVEVTDVIAQKGKEDRKVLKMRWEKAPDVALLTAQLDKKRVNVDVSRGSFATEIDRVR